MRHTRVPFLALTLIVVLGAAVRARAVDVVHEPVTCVPAGRYLRIVARGVPAEAAASAEVQFRRGPAEGWYRVRLTVEDGAWTGFLPQPTASLRRFEYRVVLFSSDAGAGETDAIAVTVATDGCPVGDTSSAAASMVVQVPPGAPLVPPVPPGFSPVGATLPQEARLLAPQRSKGGRGGKLVIGTSLVGVAGGAVAALAGGSRISDGSPGDSLVLPAFSFTGTSPPEGSTLSRSRDQFGVIVTMDSEPRVPLTVQFFVRLLASPGGNACALMAGQFAGAQRPRGLILIAPVTPTAFCDSSFDVQALELRVLVNDRAVLNGPVSFGRALRFDP